MVFNSETSTRKLEIVTAIDLLIVILCALIVLSIPIYSVVHAQQTKGAWGESEFIRQGIQNQADIQALNQWKREIQDLHLEGKLENLTLSQKAIQHEIEKMRAAEEANQDQLKTWGAILAIIQTAIGGERLIWYRQHRRELKERLQRRDEE